MPVNKNIFKPVLLRFSSGPAPPEENTLTRYAPAVVQSIRHTRLPGGVVAQVLRQLVLIGDRRIIPGVMIPSQVGGARRAQGSITGRNLQDSRCKTR